MIPTCYTTKEELAMMERQGLALMYDRLRSDDCIALYSEGRVKEMVRAEREACAKLVAANADACIINSTAQQVLRSNADAIRARGDE